MLRKAKEELLVEIFKDVSLFELEVLGIESRQEREETIHILAKRIIREKYKEKFNFLYIKDLSHFDVSLLQSILFKEIVHEFIAFCEEVLYFEKEEAFLRVKEKEKRAFIHALAQKYLIRYSTIFYTEIANTFIELIVTLPHANISNTLVQEVLQSPLVRNGNILVIYSFEQLYKRIRAAHNHKNDALSKLQIKIAEVSESLEHSQNEDLFLTLQNLQIKLQKTSETTLDNYDAAIKRLQVTMVNAMQKTNS